MEPTSRRPSTESTGTAESEDRSIKSGGDRRKKSAGRSKKTGASTSDTTSSEAPITKTRRAKPTEEQQAEILDLQKRTRMMSARLNTLLQLNQDYKGSEDEVKADNEVLHQQLATLCMERDWNSVESSRQHLRYQTELREMVVEAQRHCESFRADANSTRKKILEEMLQLRQTVTAQREEMAALRTQVKCGRHFIANKDTVVAMVEELTNSVEEAKEEHQNMIQLVQDQCLTEKRRMVKSSEKEADIVVRQAFLSALEDMKGTTSFFYEQNLTLTIMVRDMMQDDGVDSQKLEVLTYKNDKIKKETDQQKEKLAKNLSQMSEMTQKIMQLGVQVKKLEKELNDHLQSKKAQREALHKSLLDDRAVWQGKVQRVQSRIMVRMGKVPKKDSSTNTIPVQGAYVKEADSEASDSTARAFLLNALVYAREQAKRERTSADLAKHKKSPRRRKSPAPKVLPACQLTTSGSQLVEMPKKKWGVRLGVAKKTPVQTRDDVWVGMTWQEKEQVIRNFFEQLNSHCGLADEEAELCGSCGGRVAGEQEHRCPQGTVTKLPNILM